MNRKKRYFVDLFAGCGGLSLGLENAGFIPILVNELNNDALETYLLNRDDVFPLLREKYNVRDVKDLVIQDQLRQGFIDSFKRDYGIDTNNGELDLLVGGPPCQGFSGIGHRRSYSVNKEQLPSNYLYQDMGFLINKLRPKIFMFENVKGLLSSKWSKEGIKGEIWNDVLSTFKKIPHYSVRHSLLHAKDYGVPQNRPRVIIVGIRDDIANFSGKPIDAVEAGLLPKPSNNYPDLCALLGDLVDSCFENGGKTEYYCCEPQNKYQESMRIDEARGIRLSKGDRLLEQEYSKHSDKVIQKFSYMLKNNGIISDEFKTKKFAQKLLPPEWGNKGPSITATTLPDDYVHFSQPRILTIREWARLQMFPDWYKFAGKRTTGGLRRAGNPREGIFERELPKYTQIGNAVPVRLAEKIGLHFSSLLEEFDA